MTPKQAITNMVAAGISQADIARRLDERGHKTTQPTVCRIGAGEIKNPGFEIGAAIVALCAELVPVKQIKKTNKAA